MNGKPQVLVTRRLPAAVEARLVRDYRPRFNPEDKTYDAVELPQAAAKADALLVTPRESISSEVIERLPASVRIIATFSVGYEHIDIVAASKRGIVVTNTPGVLNDATADIALLLILGAARRASEGERLVREGKWVGWLPTQLLGTHLAGKRLGIVGMGRIGQAVARRATAFGMEVHYHNRSRLPSETEGAAVYHANAEEMLRISDILSLHCPATAETIRWLDARRIGMLPKGAIVVNTARGALIDDDALIKALNDGHIAAAGLDVFDGEPDIDPRYRNIPRTFLLPHLGSATVETRNAMGFTALDNLDAFFAGREPPHRVA